MGAYFSKFFPSSLTSEQRASESSGRNGRAKESGMNELNKLPAIEAKLDALIHWMNKRKSN